MVCAFLPPKSLSLLSPPFSPRCGPSSSFFFFFYNPALRGRRKERGLLRLTWCGGALGKRKAIGEVQTPFSSPFRTLLVGPRLPRRARRNPAFFFQSHKGYPRDSLGFKALRFNSPFSPRKESLSPGARGSGRSPCAPKRGHIFPANCPPPPSGACNPPLPLRRPPTPERKRGVKVFNFSLPASPPPRPSPQESAPDSASRAPLASPPCRLPPNRRAAAQNTKAPIGQPRTARARPRSGL